MESLETTSNGALDTTLRLARQALMCASAAAVASAGVAVAPSPARADGVLYKDWKWERHDTWNGATIHYIDYFRLNNSGGLGVSALPDNLDVYGGACVTLPGNVESVEVFEEFRVATVGLGGISVSMGGPSGSVSVAGGSFTHHWTSNKTNYDQASRTWSMCSDYAKPVAIGRDPGNWVHPGRIHVTTMNNGKIFQVQHRTCMNYKPVDLPAVYQCANDGNWEVTYPF